MRYLILFLFAACTISHKQNPLVVHDKWTNAPGFYPVKENGQLVDTREQYDTSYTIELYRGGVFDTLFATDQATYYKYKIGDTWKK